MREFIDLDMSRRVTHPDGFVVVPGRVARAGVQQYRAFELELPGDPMRIIPILRHPDEVFAADSLATYNGAAITVDHIGHVTPANWREKAAGTVTRPRREGNFVGADLVFSAQDAIDDINAGKRQLSATYDASLDWTAGVYEGIPYEGQQRQIRVNGVALVEAARCGPACRIDDANPKGGNMATRKILIDSIPFDLEEAAAAAVEKLAGTVEELNGEVEELRDDLRAIITYGDAKLPVSNPAAIQAVIDEQTRRMADMQKDVMTPAQRDAMLADWAKTLDTAKRLAPKVTTDNKTCAAIRREVVGGLYESKKSLVDAVLAGKSVTDAGDEAIRTAFAVLASSVPVEVSGSRRDPVADALSRAPHGHSQQPNADGGNSNAPKHHYTEDGTPDPEAARASWLQKLTAR